jgi:tetratricopeptide (TPR) repeat protein
MFAHLRWNSANDSAVQAYRAGRFEEAASLAAKAIELARRFKAPDVRLGTSLNNLAAVHLATGGYLRAEPLYREALVLREAHFSAGDPELAISLNNLAMVCDSLGKHEESLALYDRALAIDTAHFGADHPETATTTSNRAHVLQKLGRYAEGAAAYAHSLAVSERPDRVDTEEHARALNNLAHLREQEGCADEAETLFRQSITAYRTALGPTHPATTTPLNGLVGLLGARRRFAEAEPLLEELLEVRKLAYGEASGPYVHALNTQGAQLIAQGRYAEAKPVHERALELAQGLAGEGEDAGLLEHNLANIEHALGNFQAAKAGFERALRLKQKFFGASHLETANTLSAMGALRLQEGSTEAALLDFEAVLAIRSASQDDAHPAVNQAQCLFAAALRDLGRRKESLALLQQAVARLQATYAADAFELATPYGALGAAYLALDKLDLAEPLLLQGLRLKQRYLGPAHDGLLWTLLSLGRLESLRDELPSARAWFEQAAELAEAVLGPNHPDVAAALASLVDVLEREGEPETALPLAERRVPICRQAFGEDSSNELHARMTVVNLLHDVGQHDAAHAMFEQLLPAVSRCVDGGPTDRRLLASRIGRYFLDSGRALDALSYLRTGADLSAGFLPEGREKEQLRSSALSKLVIAAWLAGEHAEADQRYAELAEVAQVTDPDADEDGDRNASATRFEWLAAVAGWFERNDEPLAFSAMHGRAQQFFDGALPSVEALLVENDANDD